MAPILLARHDAPGEVEAAPAMFGIVPHWADLKLARQTYNARTEAVAAKPSFRNAWKRRQFCPIPAENIFEPSYETGKPVRWRIEDVDGEPLCIAGIWESRPSSLEGGGTLLSRSMLTIAAADHRVMSRFHQPGDENKRMVVMLRPEQFTPWLQADADDPAEFF
jgi:putative SOS response-associated peptidase YedK